MSAARPAVAIVGAGGLAAAFATALAQSGRARVTIASRRPVTAAAVGRNVRGLRAVPLIKDAVADAEIVLLAVPDRAITHLARALVPMRSSWRGVVVLHAAGAYGPELVAPLRKRGATTGVLHPLCVLGAPQDRALTGAAARLEGQAEAVKAARRLCKLVGLVPLAQPKRQTPRGRRSYHAAASLVSNDLIALLAAGRGLLVRHGVSERAALDALTTLAEGTLRAVRRGGLSGALTGPVARGDLTTLAAQLAALRIDDPAAREAHRALSLRLVDLARARGRLDAKAVDALRRLLARGRGRRRTV
jgi:predicted short-subunit dehydrogenase-like oxidoreductase (DUF2520 family)